VAGKGKTEGVGERRKVVGDGDRCWFIFIDDVDII